MFNELGLRFEWCFPCSLFSISNLAGLEKTSKNLVKRTREMINNDSLNTLWSEALETWENDEIAKVQERIDAAKEWLEAKKEQLISSINEIEDEDEINLSLALWYIELKSHWLMLETQLNYQLFHKGEINLDIHYKGTMISHLLKAFEPHLKTEDHKRISEFLISPSKS